MHSKIWSRLNSKYLRFVSLQGASRHAGIDVTVVTSNNIYPTFWNDQYQALSQYGFQDSFPHQAQEECYHWMC